MINQILTNPEEIAFLRSLIDRFVHYAGVVVEVGVWKGETTKRLAIQHLHRTLSDSDRGVYYAVDHFLGSPDLPNPEGRDAVIAAFLRNLGEAGLLSRVNCIPLASLEALPLFKPESVDMVFIDADHTYEAVLADIRGWRGKLKKGGILCGHDYDPDHPGVMRAVQEEVVNFGTSMGRFPVWWTQV